MRATLRNVGFGGLIGASTFPAGLQLFSSFAVFFTVAEFTIAFLPDRIVIRPIPRNLLLSKFVSILFSRPVYTEGVVENNLDLTLADDINSWQRYSQSHTTPASY